jgi:peptidoglycan hydrolase CwlO-like protein
MGEVFKTMKTCLKRSQKAFLCLAIAIAITITSLPVLASEDELIQISDELQNQLNTLDQELLAINDQIDATEKEIEITHAEIIRTEHNLGIAIADEARQFEDMKIRIRYIYEMGSGSLLELLLSAESIAEFINKAEFIQSINAHDREMLNIFIATQQEIQEQRDALVAKEASLIELGVDLEERRMELTAQAAATATDLDAFLAELEWMRAEEAARIIAEAARLAEEEAQRVAVEQETIVADTSPPQESDSDNIYSGSGVNQEEPPANVVAGEVVLFAALLEAEAFQNYHYLLAVATVIMNRIGDPRFPNCITSVIHAPGQFSPTWNGSLDRIIARGPTALSMQVAQDAINGARTEALPPPYVFFNTAGISSQPGINIGGNVFWTSWPSN